MKKVLFSLAIGILFIGLFLLIPDTTITAYPPSTPVPPLLLYPEWWYIDCNNPARVEIVWYDPPDNIPPFSFSNPGYLYVDYPGLPNTLMYQLTYEGIDEWGYHWWWVEYPLPVTNFTIAAFVRDQSPPVYEGWWVYPMLMDVDCYATELIYLPMIKK